MAASAVMIYHWKLNPSLMTFPLLFGIVVRFDHIFIPLRPGRIEYDERDTAIKQKSLNIAYGIFWYAFVFGSLITYFLIGPTNSMPTGVFVIMILGGAILLRLAWSIAVIIQYGIFSKEISPGDLVQSQEE
jgi:hypothetical protein